MQLTTIEGELDLDREVLKCALDRLCVILYDPDSYQSYFMLMKDREAGRLTYDNATDRFIRKRLEYYASANFRAAQKIEKYKKKRMRKRRASLSKTKG